MLLDRLDLGLTVVLGGGGRAEERGEEWNATGRAVRAMTVLGTGSGGSEGRAAGEWSVIDPAGRGRRWAGPGTLAEVRKPVESDVTGFFSHLLPKFRL